MTAPWRSAMAWRDLARAEVPGRARYAVCVGILAAVFALLMATAAPLAQAPQLLIPAVPPGAGGGGVAANLVVNLSLTFDDASAAYRAEYDEAIAYEGYFNPRLCYAYPMAGSADAADPDLDEGSGYFVPAGASDAQHRCAGLFSGNFLNWATASRLDLLRYGLTGGDRVIDTPGLTVLQRAWLPDGAFHPNFYANQVYFPRKAVSAASSAGVTPFSGALYLVSCRNRVLLSNTREGGSCDAPRRGPDGALLVSDKQLGEFNVRVAVCDAADSAGRPDLCKPHGNHFKPEGSMQRAGSLQRVGLMSYLSEQGAGDPALYGGMLRAPLKFLGPVSIDGAGPQPNGRAEWDAATGMLAANPDGGSGAVSGAINYINQLGRSNPARRGAYPTHDPGAEIFYEALRYLQGRQATTAGPAIDDGFPVWNTRPDPVSAACQRNMIATIGHAVFAGDRFVPGNTRTSHEDKARAPDGFAPGAPFDVMQATRRVGDMEADLAGAYGNPAPRAELAGLELRDSGPGGAGSHYLAGAAYWANTHPVRADHLVTVSSSALELGADQSAGASALYLAAKYGGFDDRNEDGNPFITTGERRDGSEWTADGTQPRRYYPAPASAAIIGAARALFARRKRRRGSRG